MPLIQVKLIAGVFDAAEKETAIENDRARTTASAASRAAPIGMAHRRGAAVVRCVGCLRSGYPSRRPVRTDVRPPAPPVAATKSNVDRSELVGLGADQKGRHNGWELADGLVLRQAVCSLHDVLRHPLREALFTDSMGTRTRVLLMDRRQPFARKSIGDADQGGPQAAVDEGHLPVDEPRADDVR